MQFRELLPGGQYGKFELDVVRVTAKKTREATITRWDPLLDHRLNNLFMGMLAEGKIEYEIGKEFVVELRGDGSLNLPPINDQREELIEEMRRAQQRVHAMLRVMYENRRILPTWVKYVNARPKRFGQPVREEEIRIYCPHCEQPKEVEQPGDIPLPGAICHLPGEFREQWNEDIRQEVLDCMKSLGVEITSTD